MAYEKQEWVNAPSTDSPISAAALNHMEDGIEAAHDGLEDKADASALAGKVDDDDPRLSDARTPAAHVHGAGDVTSGTLAIGRIPTGTSSSTVCIGNDSRLSDSRTPTAHNHNASDINAGTFAIARIPTGTSSSTVCVGNDARLSNTRTPTDNTVSTAKIQNGAVTAAKLASAVLANRPEVHVGTTAPVDTSMLWVDTN